MANRLIKLSSVTYIPGVPGDSGTPALWMTGFSPIGSDTNALYRKALEIYPQSTGGNYSYDIGGQYAKAASQAFSDLIRALAGTGPTAGGGATGYVEVKTLIPATKGTPSTPAKTTRSPQTGWNGGGRSVIPIANDGFVTFRLSPLNIGALVGLAGPMDSQNFAEATHAFYQIDGVYQIVESGIPVATVSETITSASVFTISRIGGVVTYTVGSFSYVSAEPSTGAVFLDALLYTADDYVQDPTVRNYSAGRAAGSITFSAGISTRPRARSSVSLGGRVVGRSDGKAFGRAIGSINLSGTSAGTGKGKGVTADSVSFGGLIIPKTSNSVVRGPKLRAVSSETDYARSRSYFSGFDAESAGGAPVINTASSVVFAAPASVKSRGITGGIGDSTVRGKMKAYSIDSALTNDGLEGWGRSTARGINHYMLTGMDIYSATDFTVQEALVFLVASNTDSTLYVSANDNLHLFESIELDLLVDAFIAEMLMLNTSHSAVFDIDLFTDDSLFVSDSSSSLGAGGLQVAVNTDTAATTVYQGFDFLRIISANGRTYGVREDGIYSIGLGFGDNGEPVDAMADFGAAKFSEMGASRVKAAFLEGSVDGQVSIMLTADDGVERSYDVIERGPVLRVSPARGVSSRVWRVRVQLSGTTAGDLERVSLDKADSARRWTR